MSLAAGRLLLELWWQQRRAPRPSVGHYLDARNEYDEAGRAVGVPPGARATTTSVGHVHVERLDLEGAGTRTVLYLHGGAYVMGSLVASRQGAVGVGRAARADVVNVGYRLAPEHPFPAAVDDAVAAFAWLCEEVDPARVVVVGSSAGGGLAVAMLVAAREQGLTMPAGLVTLSAWADLRCTARSYRRRAWRDPALSPEGLRVAAGAYLAGASPRQPLASPVLADLRGLPRTLALVGTEEILYDDTIVLVDRLRAAGVRADRHVGRGMVHCWPGFAGRLPEADRALGAIGRFIRDACP